MTENKIQMAARYLLGILLVVMGLNGFLQFMDPGMSESGKKAMGSLIQLGYLLPMVKGLEVLIGLSLLANRFVNLALVVFASIAVNIILFHIFHAPATIAGGLVVTLLGLYLGISRIDQFKTLLSAK